MVGAIHPSLTLNVAVLLDSHRDTKHDIMESF